jgi:hypothetical protein
MHRLFVQAHLERQRHLYRRSVPREKSKIALPGSGLLQHWRSNYAAKTGDQPKLSGRFIIKYSNINYLK